MRVRDAGILARFLMNRHNLHTWRLIWTHWHATVAKCVRPARQIWISRVFVGLNDVRHIEDVILHEIAHALTAGGHDEVWQEMFIRIGGSGVERPWLIFPQWVPKNHNNHNQPKVQRAVDVLVDDPIDWTPTSVM